MLLFAFLSCYEETVHSYFMMLYFLNIGKGMEKKANYNMFFQAEIAQLQEQLALKDSEIERLQCQISRTSANNETAERGNDIVIQR